MIINQSIVFIAVGLMMFTSSLAATVSDVTARQRYPWNGMVDIDYTITGADTEDTAIAVKVTDTDTGKVYTPTNFLEVPPTVAGRHRITWSTEADGLNLIASNVTVTVSLLKYDAAAITNDLFYVIDLAGPTRRAGPSRVWPPCRRADGRTSTRQRNSFCGGSKRGASAASTAEFMVQSRPSRSTSRTTSASLR